LSPIAWESWTKSIAERSLTEGAGFGFHADLQGVAVDHSAMNEVEHLHEEDHISWIRVLEYREARAGVVLFITPAE
jgi:hypothetical protein